MSLKEIFPVSHGRQECICFDAFCGTDAALIADMFGWPFVHGVQKIFIANCALALPTDAFTL
jgi:hypothetical protein